MSCGPNWSTSCFYKIKKYFTGTQSHTFVYTLSIASLAVKQQILIIAAETIWATKLKYLLYLTLYRKNLLTLD